MLAGVVLKSSVLKSLFSDLSSLIPAGAKNVPVGFNLSKGVLRVTCNALCNYEAEISVNSTDTVLVTVLYSSLQDLVSNEGESTLELQEMGINVISGDVTRFFKVAHSMVSPIEYGDLNWKTIGSSYAISALRMLAKTPLVSLYKKEPPVDVFNELAILKYPNIWVQARVPGFPCNVTFTQDCIKVISAFSPKQLCMYNNDYVVFGKPGAKLFVPVKMCTDVSTIAQLIPKDGKCVRLGMGKFGNSLRLLKLSGCSRASISMFEKAIVVQGNTEDGNVRLRLGSDESKFFCSFDLPVELLMFCFNLFTDCLVDLIYKEGVLCIRNQDLVLVVRALV